MEVVFDTEAEAEARQAEDLQCHLAVHNDSPAYTAETTRWATPRERLDGKWAYAICAHADYTGLVTEEYDATNYADNNVSEE